MSQLGKQSAIILGISIILGLSFLGILLGNAAIEIKEYERTVIVKGLAEKEYPANVVIWRIKFFEIGNVLDEVYDKIERSNEKVKQFLIAEGINEEEISTVAPSITDKQLHKTVKMGQDEFRYMAVQTVVVYSNDVDAVRSMMENLSKLGKEGVVFSGRGYGANTEYLFTRLNDIKPEMIAEATRNAREVALTFAEDSQSSLKKIKRATQGQFSIANRDNNTPYIKKIRVVSTIEYYLSD